MFPEETDSTGLSSPFGYCHKCHRETKANNDLCPLTVMPVNPERGFSFCVSVMLLSTICR